MLNPIHLFVIFAISQASVSGPAVAPDPIPAHLVPMVEASVDRNEMLIGDKFQLTIKITHNQSVQILSKGKNFNLGQFEILDIIPGVSNTEPNGVVTATDQYTLSTYFTGEFDIPPLTIEYQTKDGKKGSLQTAPIKITVKSLTPEESENLEIRDIKPPVLLLGKSYLWMVITTAVVLLILAIVGYWLYRRWKYGPKEKPLPPPIPAYEQAYQALEALRSRRDLMDGKEYKIFSIAVSEIIRLYLHNRYGIDAMDETSYETMQQIRSLSLGGNINKVFETFFEHCDLMKFARHEPDDSIFMLLIDKGVAIVDATKQTVEINAAAGQSKQESSTKE